MAYSMRPGQSSNSVFDEINEKLDRLLKCFEQNHCKKCPEKLRCLTEKGKKK